MKPDLPTEQQLQTSVQDQAHAARIQQYQNDFANNLADSPGGLQARNKTPLSQMSDLDRFGLAGLFGTIRSENPEIASLAIGHDLTVLGLDLNSTE